MEVMSLFLTCDEHSTIFCTDRGNFCLCQHSYELAGNASNCRSVTALRSVLRNMLACWLVACNSVRLGYRERVCLFVCLQCMTTAGVLKFFQKSRRHLKILDAGEGTRSKFRPEDSHFCSDL